MSKPLLYAVILIVISLAIYTASRSTDNSVSHVPAVDTVSAVDSAAEEAKAQKQEEAELSAEIEQFDKSDTMFTDSSVHGKWATVVIDTTKGWEGEGQQNRDLLFNNLFQLWGNIYAKHHNSNSEGAGLRLTDMADNTLQSDFLAPRATP